MNLISENQTMHWHFLHAASSPAEESWLSGQCKEVFTPEECARIIEIGKSRNMFTAKLSDDKVESTVRDSRVSWILPEDDSEWIYEKLEDTILSVNQTLFHYELTGFAEGFQFTEYNEPGGHYTAHIDRMNIGQTIRKLSMTIQLSDPSDYDGGELEILSNLEYPEIAPKEQGTAFIFNSMLLHRVKPVTRGTRYSLVAWVTGPRFK